MNNNLPVPGSPAAMPLSGSFDLGVWLGRRQAFGLMAGKSAAADAECLRQIRNQKLYKAKTSSWAEFCKRYIGASRPNVDRMIRYLEEFGSQFFELSEFTRIPPDAYRSIAAHVTARGIELDGEMIPLAQENSDRIAAAVAELRKRSRPANSNGRRTTQDALDAIKARFEDLIGRFLAWDGELDEDQKTSLLCLFGALADVAACAGLEIWLKKEPDPKKRSSRP